MAKGVSCSYFVINNEVQANGFINASPKDGYLRSANSFMIYENKIIPSLTMAMLMRVDPI